jgi:nucleolar protein 12
MDPYEAALLAKEQCDGSLFMERMLRVDIASKRAPALKDGGKQSTVVDGNPKLSVFVGNLDFGCKEEDLRVFFESVVSGERGLPREDKDESIGTKKTWVTRVRVVRDQETQLGKGFAYVQFAVCIWFCVTEQRRPMFLFGQDRECVDEILAMEDTKLKFAKRKLRVQRCKTLSGGSSQPDMHRTQSKSRPAARTSTSVIPTPSIPKGDPSLGVKLAHLPKEKRKEIKSSDADRVARRLAKKKARNALAKEGVKPQLKDRDRVRKPSAVKKSSVPQKMTSKLRVRSDKSLAKRNIKK